MDEQASRRLDTAERAELWSLGALILKMSLIFGVIVIAGLVTLRFVFAHDHWISKNRMTDPASGEWCCNHIDCAEVPKDGVKENGIGYFVAETGETIPYSRIIWKSQDGAWWRCRNMRTNATRCLIGPPPGS